MATVMTEKQQFLHEWFDRVWHNQDTSAIDEMFVEDGPANGLGEDRIGPEGFKRFHAALLEIVEDVRVKIDHTVEEGEWISYIGTLSVTSKRTGERAQMNGGAMCRIVDGTMLEAYNAWDFLSLFVGLGLAPANAFELCLSGKSLC